VEGDLSIHGTWSSEDLHYSLSSVGELLRALGEGMESEALEGLGRYLMMTGEARYIPAHMVANLTRGFHIYRQGMEGKRPALASASPNYTTLVRDMDALEGALGAYAQYVVDMRGDLVKLSPALYQELQDAIEGITGWEAEAFYTHHRDVVEALGMGVEVCEYEEDNETHTYVCGFRAEEDPWEIGYIPLPILLAMSQSIISTHSLAMAQYAALGIHDAYIVGATHAVQAGTALERMAEERMAETAQLYHNLSRSGYCLLEEMPPTVCGEVEPLCRQVVEMAEGEGSHLGTAAHLLEVFMASLNVGRPDWEPFFRALLSLEEVVERADELERSHRMALEGITLKAVEASEREAALEEEVEAILRRYRQENYQLIDTMVAEGGAELARSVGELLAGYEGQLAQLREKRERAVEALEERAGAYLPTACRALTEVEEGLTALKAKAVALERTARSTTAYWRDRAYALIQRGEERGLNMGLAREAWQRGEEADTLGEAYAHYREAYTLAALALRQEPGENNTALLAYVESLLSRAEEDGIDTSPERALLQRAVEERWGEGLTAVLLEIKDSILEKAALAYSDLPGLREEVWQYLTHPALQDLKAQVEAAEAGIVVGGHIDYERGLGRLHSLRELYLGVLEEVMGRRGVAVGELRVDVPLYIPFNQEVAIGIHASYHNPYPFPAEGREEWPLPAPLTFRVGGEALQVVGMGDTAEVLYRLPPLGRASLSEDVRKVLATLTELSRSKVGREGSIVEVVEFLGESQAGKGQLLLPFPGRVVVEGKELGRRESVEAALLKGPTEVVVERPTGLSYTWERGQPTITTRGGEREVSYTLTVDNPEEGLEHLTIPLLARERDASIEGDVAFEREGALLKVLSPPKGSFSLLITYTLPLDAREDVLERVEELEERAVEEGLYEQVEEEIEKAREEAEKGNYGEALEALNHAEEEVERASREKGRYKPAVDKVLLSIDEELKLLQQALAVEGPDPYGLKEVWAGRRAELTALREGLEKAVEEGRYRDAYELAKDYSRKAFVSRLLQVAKDMKREKDNAMKDYYKAHLDVEEVEELDGAFEALYAKVRTLLAKDYASLGRLQSTLVVLKEKVEEALEGKDELVSQEERLYREGKGRVEDLLSQYKDLYKRAKELGVEGYLPRSPSYYEERLKALPTGTHAAYRYSSAALERMAEELENMSALVEEVAKEKARRAFRLYHALKDGLSRRDRAKADALADELQAALKEGDHLMALSKAEELMKLLGRARVREAVDWPTFLLFLALAVGGAFLYMLLGKGRGKGSKPLRKLRRGSDMV